jgi:protocatechuate 4,5-dioxygenase, alpha chain
MALDKPYANVPGTVIFDADQSRVGYQLNMFAMSLMKAENRERFKANERAYLDEWKMTEDQKQAVLARDYNKMISLGGNIYFLAKIFATDGKSFQYAAALMTGMSQEEYAKMMLTGGRSPDSKHSTGEN